MDRFRTFTFLLFFLQFVIASCAPCRWRVVTPEGVTPPVEWTDAEKGQILSIRNLHATAEASHHIIRLNGTEDPHYHDRHDLTVSILKGCAKIHFDGKTHKLKRGDVVHIPRGVKHWGESKKPVEAYAVFAPPMNEKDYRVAA